MGQTLVKIAQTKAGYHPLQAFALAVLCNGLVCLAVWLSFAGRSVIDKMAAIALPVMAFVALGLEHCVANFLYIPYGIALAPQFPAGPALVNLCAVTAGNIVGGTLLVAGVYWVAYLRKP